jgi:hypothetical protein
MLNAIKVNGVLASRSAVAFSPGQEPLRNALLFGTQKAIIGTSIREHDAKLL